MSKINSKLKGNSKIRKEMNNTDNKYILEGFKNRSWFLKSNKVITLATDVQERMMAQCINTKNKIKEIIIDSTTNRVQTR